MARRNDIKPPEEVKAEIQAVYPDVLKLVEEGLTIQNAMKELKISPNKFYANITPIQKVELSQAKAAYTHFGSRFKSPR